MKFSIGSRGTLTSYRAKLKFRISGKKEYYIILTPTVCHLYPSGVTRIFLCKREAKNVFTHSWFNSGLPHKFSMQRFHFRFWFLM